MEVLAQMLYLPWLPPLAFLMTAFDAFIERAIGRWN
jgi:hypothetical protein